MAYTFLAAQNIEVGRSLVEKDKVALAAELITRFKNRQKNLILPVDHVVAPELKTGVTSEVTSTAAIPKGMMGLDVGPKTISLISEVLVTAKTVFWNGPLGAFETKPFDRGTFSIAHKMAELTCTTIVGGGDSVTAVEEAGMASRMTHISTGGGASLEYLEGKSLPGLEVLRA
jgi:phosphoglycerate kinase